VARVRIGISDEADGHPWLYGAIFGGRRWLGVLAFGLCVQSSRVTGAATQSPCPDEMVLVDGRYCPQVQQRCRRWLDDPRLPFARCALYEQPSVCLAARTAMRFCIDRYEYTPPAQALPLNYVSLAKATKLCASLGKRICSEEEWNFACEGEAMQPYPYGFERRGVCNQDRYDLYVDGPHGQTLRDLREPARVRPDCVSPFGVFNMTGNMDEPARRGAGTGAFNNALKGGWWMPSQNRCRFATTAHDDFYEGIQVGARCCADAPRPR